MTDQQFEYDVAFSFTARDEAVAQQLNDLISDRLHTFLYSERQKEIAGTDGQESFSRVYGSSARLVVILYRPEYGTTPWTRVEQDAIKNRSLSDGWDFTVFIPTGENREMPPWLPRTRLYVGLERWGLQGAASAIEMRVTERGGSVHPETFGDRAARFARADALLKEQKAFFDSDSGAIAAKHAYAELTKALQDLCNQNMEPKLQFLERDEVKIISGLPPVNLIISWRLVYSNTLADSKFEAIFYKGIPRLRGMMGSIDPAVKLSSIGISYGLVRSGEARYLVQGAGGKREFTPEQLAEHLLMAYLDSGEKHRRR